MRNTIALALILLAAVPALAADGDLVVPPVTYPVLPFHEPTPEQFAPPGWRVESKVEGDLDGDGLKDVALVLRQTDPRNIVDASGQGGPAKFDTNPRILVVAFASQTPVGGYHLQLQNHTLIARVTAPTDQDPLDPNGVQPGGIAIAHGTLQVTLGYFAGNMGHMTYTFRLQGGRFMLIGYDGLDVDRGSGAMTEISIDYPARRMKHSAGTISSDTDKVTWTTLPRKPLLTLEQVGDGTEFQPPEK
jgi:hypothetical protein